MRPCVVVLVGATALNALGGEVATKGWRASWGIINVKLFIPLARILGVRSIDGATGK
jgi:hypothetical protein